MAWTQADADALRAAIATGVQSVTFGNRTVSYHSLEQMRAVLADMERTLSTAARTFRVAAFDKGV